MRDAFVIPTITDRDRDAPPRLRFRNVRAGKRLLSRVPEVGIMLGVSRDGGILCVSASVPTNSMNAAISVALWFLSGRYFY